MKRAQDATINDAQLKMLAETYRRDRADEEPRSAAATRDALEQIREALTKAAELLGQAERAHVVATREPIHDAWLTVHAASRARRMPSALDAGEVQGVLLTWSAVAGHAARDALPRKYSRGSVLQLAARVDSLLGGNSSTYEHGPAVKMIVRAARQAGDRNLAPAAAQKALKLHRKIRDGFRRESDRISP